MNIKSFVKTFVVVFFAAFVSNVAVAYLWSNFFQESRWQWDTTTATAGLVGVVLAYLFHRKKSEF